MIPVDDPAPCDTLAEAVDRLVCASCGVARFSPAAHQLRAWLPLVAFLRDEVTRLGGPAWSVECVTSLMRGERFVAPDGRQDFVAACRDALAANRALAVMCGVPPTWALAAEPAGLPEVTP